MKFDILVKNIKNKQFDNQIFKKYSNVYFFSGSCRFWLQPSLQPNVVPNIYFVKHIYKTK